MVFHGHIEPTDGAILQYIESVLHTTDKIVLLIIVTLIFEPFKAGGCADTVNQDKCNVPIVEHPPSAPGPLSYCLYVGRSPV